MPSEFGLIGMVSVFVGVSGVFVNCGFGEALIQKRDATLKDESSVFYVNVFLGLIASLCLFVAAPWIAHFYEQPALLQLTRWMALNIVVGSFGVVQTMLLTKKLDFKTQIKISIISAISSGTIAILMALNGFGVMSLVAQTMIGTFLSTIMLWVFQGWRPILSFSLDSLKTMFPYGSRLFVSGLLNSIFIEIYSIIIGKLYDPAVLGFYTRARQLQQLPVDNISGIVGRVSFPVFASIHEDKIALKRGVRKGLKGLAWLTFPIMVGMGLTARPLVLVLLTDKWEPCIPFIRLLCVYGALYPLSLIHVNALSAQGRSDLFLKVEIIKKVLVIVGIVATFHFGVTGLLVGNIAVGILSYYLNSHYSARLIEYSWKEQILDLLPYVGLSALMGVFVFGSSFLPLRGNISLLSIQIIVGVGSYAVGCWLTRDSSFLEAFNLLQSKLPFLKSSFKPTR